MYEENQWLCVAYTNFDSYKRLIFKILLTEDTVAWLSGWPTGLVKFGVYTGKSVVDSDKQFTFVNDLKLQVETIALMHVFLFLFKIKGQYIL